MRLKPVSLPAVFFSMILLSEPSCKFDNLEELQRDFYCDTTTDVSYQSDVVPVLEANCYRCHGESVYPFLGNGNRLEGYSFLKVYVNDGRLRCAINHTPCAQPMPQGAPKLPDSTIAVIDTWICQGAADN
ncbi:MAG TPA: hypothetical protein VNJ07_03855 [Chitinophagales bacterium]|nr:hypothetical protein [Chitinophagales bacterium]